MPCATERIRVVGNTRANTDGTECGNGLKEDGVDVEAWGWDREGVALYDADEEEADENPPCVRCELPLQMGLQESAGYYLMDFNTGMCLLRYMSAPTRFPRPTSLVFVHQASVLHTRWSTGSK